MFLSVGLDVIGKNSNSKLLINLCFKMMRFNKSFLIATILHC